MNGLYGFLVPDGGRWLGNPESWMFVQYVDFVKWQVKTV